MTEQRPTPTDSDHQVHTCLARATSITAGLDQIRPDLEQLYRGLHAHPELSFAEHQTADRMAELLRVTGFEVTRGLGGTGVVGVLRNGPGPTVLFRADMDALPVVEETGLDYASTQLGMQDGKEVGVMHACGHDMHMTWLIGATRLLAEHLDAWSGTLIALFQPAEETAGGAAAMVADGLAEAIPRPDVALGQHLMPLSAGVVSVHAGPAMAAADSIRVRVFGRGGHGSMPQSAIDPVVLASAIVLRLQTIVGRELAPGTPAVVTVGALHAGSKSNVIADHADLLVNVRTFDEEVRGHVLTSIERIITAECEASQSPKPPTFEYYDRFPLTVNDPALTYELRTVFTDFLGQAPIDLGPSSGSEDFSLIPDAFGAPYCYWYVGGTDPDAFAAAAAAGRVMIDIPVNHSPRMAPVIQPTLDVGVRAAVAALCRYLGPAQR